MNRLTVCIFSIVKEPQNTTVFEEPPGAVEIEDLSQQGKSMKPPRIRWTQCMSGHREHEHFSASIHYDTFDQYLEAQQQYAWIFHHTLFSIKFQDLVDAIKEGWAIAISDGSHKNKWGTASWRIMSDTNEDEQCTGLHVTPGRKDDQSAFRSEIGGVYAMAV
jgi:hypothetical protein